MTKPKRVEVTWEDSAADKGWVPVEDVGKLGLTEIVTSVGYLQRINTKVVILSQSINRSNYCADILTIPRRIVKKIRKLK